METDKRIQILLSTYNGEKYLREQLDSFVSLDNYSEIKVLIRDDGSSDGTRLILDEYKRNYGFDIIYGENLGVNKSIFVLLENCDMNCEYFALSDQDDVWINDKIVRSVNALDKLDNNRPQLFSTISEVVDSNLEHLGITTLCKCGATFYNAIVQNIAPGHTQMLNQKTVQFALEHGYDENIFVVDWWFYIIASAFGGVYFENTPTVKHRQHGGNAVGCQTNWFKYTIARIKRARNGEKNLCARQLNAFYKLYGCELSDEYKAEVYSYISSLPHFLSRLRYVFHTKSFMQSRSDTLLYKLLYLLGKYKI